MHRKDLAQNPACEVPHTSQLLSWLLFFLWRVRQPSQADTAPEGLDFHVPLS